MVARTYVQRVHAKVDSRQGWGYAMKEAAQRS